MVEKTCLADFSYEELTAIAEGLGEKSFRTRQLYDAVLQYKGADEITTLPKKFLSAISESYVFKGVEIIESYKGKDGAEKYLYKMYGGDIIEGVFMPHGYGNTLCVSTQAGCRMGCAFCASGLDGLRRNLTAGEILSQVICVNARHGGTRENRKVTNIVLMGSGEPLDNFDNTVKFLRLVSSEDGMNISLRNISLSTCGVVPRIIELADLKLPVVLTISLHSADDEKRSEIMPVNRAYNIASVIEAAKYYFANTKRRIIFEYALIEGKNSSAEDALKLANLLKGLPCHVNLINLNGVKKRNLRGISGNLIKEFSGILTANGISNTLRRSMGNDIQGACGQLRNQYDNNAIIK